MKKILISLLLFSLIIPCFAKARYAGKKEMIKEADAIVIVTITKTEKIDYRGKHWGFREKATATVEKCLKGDVKGEITILGRENFECANCDYEKGRFLLFLRKSGKDWCGSNWQLGIRPIKEKNVEWFESDDALFKMKETPLDQAIAEIKEIL